MRNDESPGPRGFRFHRSMMDAALHPHSTDRSYAHRSRGTPGGAGGSLWKPFHKTDKAIVFHVDLAANGRRENRALAWLDESERQRRNRFLHPRPRRQFTLCRAALRQLLCNRLGCRNDQLSFAAARHGKPFALVNGTPVVAAFNVSHGGRHGLIALASTEHVGVDVEERSPRRDLDGDIRVLFAPGERSALKALSGRHKTELFYRLWTLKEALIKATGFGLSVDTAGFDIPRDIYAGTGSGLFSLPGSPGESWYLECLDNASFSAALACDAWSASSSDTVT